MDRSPIKPYLLILLGVWLLSATTLSAQQLPNILWLTSEDNMPMLGLSLIHI